MRLRRNIALISHFESVKRPARSCIVVEHVSEASESDPRRLSRIALLSNRARWVRHTPHRPFRAGRGACCCFSVR